MPRTKKNVNSTAQPTLSAPPTTAVKESVGEVLTLEEAAAFLRWSEADVRRLVQEQGLPGRQLGEEWRFLKSALRIWLSTPRIKENKEGIWAAAGSWKDDPYLEEMLKQIDRMRGRPESEGS